MTAQGTSTPFGGEGSRFFQGVTELQRRWLSAYVETYDAVAASKKSGVAHLEAMEWWRDDAKFQAALEEGRFIIGLTLEGKFSKIALDEKGSDRLRIELLKAYFPLKYNPQYSDPENEDEDDGGFTGIEVNTEPESPEEREA